MSTIHASMYDVAKICRRESTYADTFTHSQLVLRPARRLTVYERDCYKASRRATRRYHVPYGLSHIGGSWGRWWVSQSRTRTLPVVRRANWRRAKVARATLHHKFRVSRAARAYPHLLRFIPTSLAPDRSLPLPLVAPIVLRVRLGKTQHLATREL